ARALLQRSPDGSPSRAGCDVGRNDVLKHVGGATRLKGGLAPPARRRASFCSNLLEFAAMARRTGSMLLVMGALVVAAAALPVRAEPGNAPAARRRALQVGQAAPPLSVDRVRGDEAVTLDGLAGR